MPDLTIITPAYYPDEEKISLLKQSCAINNLRLVPFGVGQSWPGDHVAHFTGAAIAIQNLRCGDNDLVLFTDGEDAFMLPRDLPMEKMLPPAVLSGDQMLLAAECSLYPWGLEPVWEHRKPSGEAEPYQYPNGGGWIGTKRKLLGVLNVMYDYYEGEAQGRWIRAYCDGDLGIVLDCQCRVFQTMSFGGEAVSIPRRGYVYNRRTDSFPYVIHFNGKSGGAPKFFKEVYENAG